MDGGGGLVKEKIERSAIYTLGHIYSNGGTKDGCLSGEWISGEREYQSYVSWRGTLI